jgi:hypothetical protein
MPAIQRGPILSVKRLLFPLLSHPRASQTIKYFVYASLVVNFFLYAQDDYMAFRSALPPDASLADVFIQFATTIDTIAWLGLVFLLELETYAIPDEFWTNWIRRLIHGARVGCYVMIVFAAYGYTADSLDTYTYTEVAGVNDACEIADEGISLQINAIDYVEITPRNCGSLPADTSFFRLEGEVSVIGASTLAHIQTMGWFDIINAYVWIVVVLLIEFEVRMAATGRSAGPSANAVRQANTLFYLILIGNGVVWLFHGYYLWARDAFLWIFGFWAIELNLTEWEIDSAKKAGKVAQEPA